MKSHKILNDDHALATFDPVHEYTRGVSLLFFSSSVSSVPWLIRKLFFSSSIVAHKSLVDRFLKLLSAPARFGDVNKYIPPFGNCSISAFIFLSLSLSRYLLWFSLLSVNEALKNTTLFLLFFERAVNIEILLLQIDFRSENVILSFLSMGTPISALIFLFLELFDWWPITTSYIDLPETWNNISSNKIQ